MDASLSDDDVRYLRHVLQATGLTAGGLAKEAGVAGSTLTRRLNSSDYKFVLSMPTIRKIEIASGIGYASFVAGRSSALPEDAAPERERTRGQRILHVPAERVVSTGRERLVVYSGAQGGSGKLIISTDIVDRVAMPEALKDVQGAYGLMIDGESMIPEYWPGDVAWVNPLLRPLRTKNHIFYHTPPGGEDAEAIVKRLNGWNDREWDLEQWNPAQKFKEYRQEWPICHRVVGKYDAA